MSHLERHSWTAIRRVTRIVYSLRRHRAAPYSGLRRAERAQETLSTSQGALWGYHPSTLLGVSRAIVEGQGAEPLAGS